MPNKTSILNSQKRADPLTQRSPLGGRMQRAGRGSASAQVQSRPQRAGRDAGRGDTMPTWQHH